jgi:hypothetical protein
MMDFGIVEIINTLLTYKVPGGSYLQLGVASAKVFESVAIKDKVYVFRKPRVSNGIVMSISEYLDGCKTKFDVIYSTPGSMFEDSIEKIKRTLEILSDKGVIILNYSHVMVDRICLYLRAFQKHLYVDSIVTEYGAMALIGFGKSEDDFAMSLDEISKFNNEFMSQDRDFNVEELDKETKKLFSFRENDYMYELLSKDHPKLLTHLESIMSQKLDGASTL